MAAGFTGNCCICVQSSRLVRMASTAAAQPSNAASSRSASSRAASAWNASLHEINRPFLPETTSTGEGTTVWFGVGGEPPVAPTAGVDGRFDLTPYTTVS